jgi:hypothetical protein
VREKGLEFASLQRLGSETRDPGAFLARPASEPLVCWGRAKPAPLPSGLGTVASISRVPSRARKQGGRSRKRAGTRRLVLTLRDRMADMSTEVNRVRFTGHFPCGFWK